MQANDGRFARLALLSTLLCAGAAQANAPQSSNYARVYGGYTVQDDQSFDRLQQTEQMRLDSGWMAGGSVGVEMNPNLALEVGWDYAANTIHKVDGATIDDGEYTSKTFYLASVFSPAQLSNTSLRPYVGLGIGLIQDLEVELVENGVKSAYSTGGDVVAQWMIGIRQDLNEQSALQLEMRGVRASELTLDGKSINGQITNIDYEPLHFNASLVFKF